MFHILERRSWKFAPEHNLDQEMTTTFQPQGEFELFSISNAHPEKHIKIDTSLPHTILQEVWDILFEYKEYFHRPHMT